MGRKTKGHGGRRLTRGFTKIIAMMLVCIVTISSEVYAGENNIDESEKSYKEFTQVTSDTYYDGYQLEWEFNAESIYDLLSKVSYDNEILESYTYDDRFLRTSKNSGGDISTYMYDENYNMITACEGENVLNYFYDIRNNNSLYVKGFTFNGED